MRKLHILTCQPSDKCFNWQTRVQLHNARVNNCSHYFRVLVFTPHDRLGEDLSEWKKLEADFPEARFFYYPDTDNILRVIRIFGYIPLLRPHCIARHYRQFPELSNDSVFYIDSDVLLHKGVDFLSPFLQDDIVYMSDGKSYNNSDYFDSKIKDVLPHKLESYQEVDVLNTAAGICWIDREVCEQNKNATGAAQYLLKNIDAQFFDDLFSACCAIKLYLTRINQQFFESEDKGFQGWCADIYATNWLLWHRKIITTTPQELNFSWSTDPLSSWETNNIYHDAGAPVDGKTFNKRKTEYINNLSTPFQDDLSWVSAEYCSYNYVQQILETKNTFTL